MNSVKQRVPRLLPWLDQRQPDVVCMQETKLTDDAFAELLGDALAQRDYSAVHHGEGWWNGVAILSKVCLDDAVSGLADAPGFPNPEARAVSATCGGVRVHSVYVPNGRVPGSEHYHYKLAWLAALRDVVAAGPESVIVGGDVNIALLRSSMPVSPLLHRVGALCQRPGSQPGAFSATGSGESCSTFALTCAFHVQ